MFCCHWQSSCSSPQHLICEMSFITCIKHYFYYKNVSKTTDFIYCQTNVHHPLPLTPSCWQSPLFAPFLFHSLCSIPPPLLISSKVLLPNCQSASHAHEHMLLGHWVFFLNNSINIYEFDLIYLFRTSAYTGCDQWKSYHNMQYLLFKSQIYFNDEWHKPYINLKLSFCYFIR